MVLLLALLLVFSVVLFLFLVMASLCVRRVVALCLDSPPKLDLEALEFDFFQREDGEASLGDGRRESLFACCHVVPVNSPESESAAEWSAHALLENTAVGEPVVIELCADGRFPVLEVLDFVVDPVDVAEFQFEPLDCSA